MLAICGGKVYSMSGPILERGCVLVDGGKVVAVGDNLFIPEDCEIFDATGKVVTPGLIDAHTHLGVYAEPAEWSAEDGNETSGPVTPAMDAMDAINPTDVAFDDALAGDSDGDSIPDSGDAAKSPGLFEKKGFQRIYAGFRHGCGTAGAAA